MPKIIDLSHEIHPDMPVYPGTESPTINEICSIEKHGFKESLFSFYSHVGTHIDVPAHLLKNGKSIDLYNCEQFFGTALLIDCQNKKDIELQTIKESFNESESTDFIILYTGWDKWWGTRKYFLDFPVLTQEAAAFISTLPIKGLGIDAISYDPVGDKNLANHKILMKQNIVLAENLCSLEKLLGKQFIFSCIPLNIKGADGSPTRAFALIS